MGLFRDVQIRSAIVGAVAVSLLGLIGFISKDIYYQFLQGGLVARGVYHAWEYPGNKNFGSVILSYPTTTIDLASLKDFNDLSAPNKSLDISEVETFLSVEIHNTTQTLAEDVALESNENLLARGYFSLNGSEPQKFEKVIRVGEIRGGQRVKVNVWTKGDAYWFERGGVTLTQKNGPAYPVIFKVEVGGVVAWIYRNWFNVSVLLVILATIFAMVIDYILRRKKLKRLGKSPG